MGARICVRRVRRDMPVMVLLDDEEVGVEEELLGVEGRGVGCRVRIVRRREVGVRVRWGERVGGRGGVKIWGGFMLACHW